MKVRATEMSARLNVKIKELHRVASPGEEFDVSPSRFKVLSGDNRFKAVFVVKAKDELADAEGEPVKKKRASRGSKSKKNKVEEEPKDLEEENG